MVFQLVLQFVFQEDKLETTPVTVERLIGLKQRHGPARQSAELRSAWSLGAGQQCLPGGAAGAAGSSPGFCSPSGRRHTTGSASLRGSWRSVEGRPSRRRSETNTPTNHTCVRRPGGPAPGGPGDISHTHLADIGHFSWFVVGLHVTQEDGFSLKRPLANSTHS